ncbi:MAG TPA: alpha-2-macroglobulin family protein, partial [Polyangiaceae bacterium]|nr:alpha-2-macroglobulin family protein [Polyangiaceae bacterium]
RFIEIARGSTGKGGDATLAVRFPDDFMQSRSLVALVSAGVAEGSDDFVVDPREPATPAIFVATDKPIYQPGQTVHIRAVALADGKPAADRPVVIEIRAGAERVKVFRIEKQTSAFGVAWADFELADQVKLGSYSIAVTSPVSKTVTANGDRDFEVKRYSLPKLTVAFDEPGPFAPDKAFGGAARAKWVFGEPVTRGTIKVTLERGSEVLRTATGAPDKEGVFKFSLLSPTKKPEPKKSGALTLRARLEVEGGMRAETSRPVRGLGISEVKLEAFPESGALAAGAEQTVYVVATADEKAGVTVRAGDGPPVKTNDRGIAVLSVRASEKKDPIELVGHAQDGAEGKLTLVPEDRLVVRPDRLAYTAGEKVRVTVLGALPGEHVAVRASKGAQPVATGTCIVGPDSACETTLALSDGVAGLLWIHALSLPVPGGGQRVAAVRSGRRLVLAGTDGRDLALKVTPDKALYAPRETGSVDVTVTKAGGGPAQAQLSVGVADEAVFALSAMRPDLEKIFFTTNADLNVARRGSRTYRDPYGSNRELRVPAPYEAAQAYDGTTPPEVRGLILAALSSMPEEGGFEGSSTSVVAERAREVVGKTQEKLAAWAILLLVGLALSAFTVFGLYGVSRFRKPLLLVASDTASEVDPLRLKLETRGLMTEWLLAVLAPPALGVLVLIATELFDGGSRGSEAAFKGAWLILGPFCSVMLLRAVLRVRRVLAGTAATTLRRVLMVLPVASLLGHLAAAFVVIDEGTRLARLLGFTKTALLLPILLAIAAQLTFGFLSVIRQGLLKPLTAGKRAWLMSSRASFIGLPIALILLVPILFSHVRRRIASDWTDYTYGRYETEQVATDHADNREGGTGTRAKGEEGSMGNPNSRPGAPAAAARMSTASPVELPAAGPASKPIVRDYFPETLLWLPEVITDAAGHATVKVPFADSITTWRFGLSAVGRDGQLGNTTASLVVMQDFFVEAALPPMLTQGDEISVPVTVYSYTKGPQQVAIELKGDGITAVGQSRASVVVGPRETRGLRFVIRADKAGERVVRLQATSATRGDAVERKLLVTPKGLSVTRVVNGRLDGTSTAKLELPANAIDGGNDLYVKVYGGPLSQLAEGLDGVFRMPYGCFEQVTSTTYPSVLALEFLSRTKTVSPELESKARRYIGVGYQRIVSFESSSGGFSMYGSGSVNTVLTAYGLMGLSDMARLISVDESLIERTRNWLYGRRSQSGGWARPAWWRERENQAAPDDPLTTAYIAWALASSTAKASSETRLVSVLDGVARESSAAGTDPYGLALRANALIAGGRKDLAMPLLDRLAGLAVRGDDGIHWSSKQVGVLHSFGSSLDVEVTGLASHAFA